MGNFTAVNLARPATLMVLATVVTIANAVSQPTDVDVWSPSGLFHRFPACEKERCQLG